MWNYLDQFPFIAITRGITPSEASSCAEVLFNAGFRIIEIPLNSPDPYTSIKAMVDKFGDRVLFGAGTVETVEQITAVAEAGGQLIVSPHCDIEIIRATKEKNMISVPGVVTPTEAIAAIGAGADALKLFPAEMIPPQAVKAMLAVLPKNTLLLPVGGIDSENWAAYRDAGAGGVGLGSSLYKKGIETTQLNINARLFQASWKQYREQGMIKKFHHER